MRVTKVEKCFIDEILFKTQLSNCFREISLSLRVHKLLVITIDCCYEKTKALET